jgi:hypothetical protein
MTVRELLEEIIETAPNRLDSEIYFETPMDGYSVKCYMLDDITSYGNNDSLFFILKENI